MRIVGIALLLLLPTGLQAQSSRWMIVLDSTRGGVVEIDTLSIRTLPQGVAAWFKWSGKLVADEKPPISHSMRRLVVNCETGEAASVAGLQYGLDGTSVVFQYNTPSA